MSDTLVKRIWAKDSTVWTNKGEENWLGWLDIIKYQIDRLDELINIQNDFKKFNQVALLGMGGSSLGPEVLTKTFGSQEGFPQLSVLDSTDPDQIRAFDQTLDITKTCFIISSKSGSTLEPNIFLEYFYKRAADILGSKCGEHFVAITDPGSTMEARAKDLNFRAIYYGFKNIGGRFSILSDFGIIPACAIGLDLKDYLTKALTMVQLCKANSHNPGESLGLAMGELASRGQDKITLVASPELSSLPGWIEQLVAESTGKEGKGIIPVVEEDLMDLDQFGGDRHFIYIKLVDSKKNFDREFSQLREKNHPVTIILTASLYDLGGEFFRWQFATAVAGAILGVNPFDQPDVEASKIETKRLMSQIEKTGELPPTHSKFSDKVFEIFTDEEDWRIFDSSQSVQEIISRHLARLKPNDYVGLLSYIDMNASTEKALGTLKKSIQTLTKAAVCVGFGPRFLHSTGQAYKGGPNTGVFIQIASQPKQDLRIPNHRYTFGLVKKAQALGDFQVLVDRKRRALRLLIKGDLEVGLEKLSKIFSQVTI